MEDLELFCYIGKRVKLVMYYEGSKHTIYKEYEGSVKLSDDGVVFVSDCGRRIHENTLDNYDVVRIEKI